jgi:hypothetical protein
MFSTSGIGLSATKRWKEKVIFCQSGRLLANQSESQPQVNYVVLIFAMAIHQDCGKSVQRMPPRSLLRL